MKTCTDMKEENMKNSCDTKKYAKNHNNRNVLIMEENSINESSKKAYVISRHNEAVFIENRHVTEEHIKNMLQHRLPVEKTEQIQNHLAQCTYCADLFAKVMEQGYLVSPPPDMKARILRKSQSMRRRKEYSKKMQLFFYSLRVGVAMCFSLVLLFATGDKQSGVEMQKTKENSGFQIELLNNINQNINEVTTKIITMEGIKNDTEKE